LRPKAGFGPSLAEVPLVSPQMPLPPCRPSGEHTVGMQETTVRGPQVSSGDPERDTKQLVTEPGVAHVPS
jgi:hypothetical protein